MEWNKRWNVWLPNEDFGRPNRPGTIRMPLIPFFRQSPRIAATISSNNSTWIWSWRFWRNVRNGDCLKNGMSCIRLSGTSFRRTFQGCEYSIWAKNRWKVRRKDVPDGLFGLPKSSFGVFSVASGPNWVLTPLKTASNIRISSLVPHSIIFVWGAAHRLFGLPKSSFGEH